ncbi:MAG: metallophosphoesterase family protein [Proteobacteria bacterium]|uniref:metallophosphoesterase family protein n=1 Tax=Aquabacterium sp. TaxID=1872578 RepID=UPI0035C71B46|nr:metallophosphoesterase family protein [Pseudomonadota bacterium]
MRLALVSDIHGNLAALEAVRADIRRRGVDAVLNLGDSLSGPLLPLETAQCLMAEGWFSLAGNHERQMQAPLAEQGASDAHASAQLGEAERAWMAALRPWQAWSDEVFLCHGTPASDAAYLMETVQPVAPAQGVLRMATQAELDERLGTQGAVLKASLIACGHTHVPRVMRSARGACVVNPGSVGRPAYDDTRPLCHRVEMGSPDARYAIVERHRQGWTVSLLAVPCDHRAMAELARQRGRAEWAHALLTGFMPLSAG